MASRTTLLPAVRAVTGIFKVATFGVKSSRMGHACGHGLEMCRRFNTYEGVNTPERRHHGRKNEIRILSDTGR